MSTPATSTALMVIDRTTGEVIPDVTAADTETLAQWTENLATLRTELNDAEAIVNPELVVRLDRKATWTQRVGDPKGTHQYEIKAPSPTSATVTYNPVILEGDLVKLVARKTIDHDGAREALTRTVTVVVDVPLDADPLTIVDALERDGAELKLAGVAVTLVSVRAARKVSASGIKKLLKIAGTKAAIKRAEVVSPPRSPHERKATVKVITKAGA